MVAVLDNIVLVDASAVWGYVDISSVITWLFVSLFPSFVGIFSLRGFPTNGLETIRMSIPRDGANGDGFWHSLILGKLHCRMLALLLHHWMKCWWRNVHPLIVLVVR